MKLCRKIMQVLYFLCFYAHEIIVSNLRVILAVFSPIEKLRTGIIAITLDAETDLEILLVTHIISMTPGTLSLDVSNDRKTLYVHSMFIGEVELTRNQIKNYYEKKVLEVLRA